MTPEERREVHTGGFYWFCDAPSCRAVRRVQLTFVIVSLLLIAIF